MFSMACIMNDHWLSVTTIYLPVYGVNQGSRWGDKLVISSSFAYMVSLLLHSILTALQSHIIILVLR